MEEGGRRSMWKMRYRVGIDGEGGGGEKGIKRETDDVNYFAAEN